VAIFARGMLHWQRERLVARVHCDGRAFADEARVGAPIGNLIVYSLLSIE
jgi:hypothetical protein